MSGKDYTSFQISSRFNVLLCTLVYIINTSKTSNTLTTIMASRNLYVFEKCVDIGIISPLVESNIIYTLSKNIFKCDGKWYVEEDDIQEEKFLH